MAGSCVFSLLRTGKKFFVSHFALIRMYWSTPTLEESFTVAKFQMSGRMCSLAYSH